MSLQGAVLMAGINGQKVLEVTPAACFLAFQTFLVVATAMQLLFGQTDSLYKYEPHTQKIASRSYEKALGANLLGWGAGMAGALIAGGAQSMCSLQLPPMLAATYYHYTSGGKPSTILNCVFMAALAYFGFVPTPTLPSIEWTPAACFLAFQASLILLTASTIILGQTDGFYKFAPQMKEFMSRLGEIQLGACYLGWGCGVTGALIYGGAQNMCVLELAPLALCTYQHYTCEGGKTNALVNTVFMAVLAYFGFVR
jgi:hypothetical protein